MSLPASDRLRQTYRKGPLTCEGTLPPLSQILLVLIKRNKKNHLFIDWCPSALLLNDCGMFIIPGWFSLWFKARTERTGCIKLIN